MDRQSDVNIWKEQRSREECAGIRRMWPELAMPTTVPTTVPTCPGSHTQQVGIKVR